MRAEAITYAMLNAATGLAALVGTRIYLDNRPEGDPLPAVVYELIHSKQDNAKIGEQEKVTAHMQINCLGQQSEDAVNVREQVRLACHNQSGIIGGYTVIDSIEDHTGGDSYDHLVNTYNKPIDITIHYLR